MNRRVMLTREGAPVNGPGADERREGGGESGGKGGPPRVARVEEIPKEGGRGSQERTERVGEGERRVRKRQELNLSGGAVEKEVIIIQLPRGAAPRAWG